MVKHIFIILLTLCVILSSCGDEKGNVIHDISKDAVPTPRLTLSRDSLEKIADSDIFVWLTNREKIDSVFHAIGKHDGYNEFKFGMSSAEFDIAVRIWQARPCHNLVIGDVCYENLQATFFHDMLYELKFSTDKQAVYRYTNENNIREKDKFIDKPVDELFPNKKYLAKEHFVNIGSSYTYYLILYNPVIKKLIKEADKFKTYDIPTHDLDILKKIIKYKRDSVIYKETEKEYIKSLEEESHLVSKMEKIVATRYK